MISANILRFLLIFAAIIIRAIIIDAESPSGRDDAAILQETVILSAYYPRRIIFGHMVIHRRFMPIPPYLTPVYRACPPAHQGLPLATSPPLALSHYLLSIWYMTIRACIDQDERQEAMPITHWRACHIMRRAASHHQIASPLIFSHRRDFRE